MKKSFTLLFSLITVLLLVTPEIKAQQYNFAHDENGETYVLSSITYEGNSYLALSRLKEYLQTIYDDELFSFDPETGVIRIVNATVEAKNIYQPFVGEMKDYVFYDLTITPQEDAKRFRCTFSNLELYSTIKGVIHKEYCDTIGNILKQYALGKISTRAKANLATSLSIASETLYVLIERVQENVE